MRKFSGSEVQQRTRSVMNSQSWDYSFQHVPWRCKIVWIVLCFICWVIHLSVVACTKTKIAGDTSLMTYRGHSVLRTLIRCRFSPAFSTGQRYIYSGCAAGKVFSKKMSCKSLIWETTSREKKISISLWCPDWNACSDFNRSFRKCKGRFLASVFDGYNRFSGKMTFSITIFRRFNSVVIIVGWPSLQVVPCLARFRRGNGLRYRRVHYR